VTGREAIHKVRSVRMVAPEYPAYLAAMAEQALAHRRFGPKEEQTATYRVSGRIELGVRGWLAARVPLLEQRVIAADVLYRDERSYVPLFLELDAVEGEDATPRRIYEVKFTSNAGALRRGFAQLARARHILSARYDPVETVLILVQADRGDLVLDDRRLDDVAVIGSDDLPGVARLPARALLPVAPALLSPFLAAEDLVLLQRARDEGDANVSARLERSAAVERGEELPARPRGPRLPGVTLSFGDDTPEDEDQLAQSPFAALRSIVSDPGP